MENENDDLLIVKVNTFLRPDSMDALSKYIQRGKEVGVIVLPHFCEVIACPKDVDIIVEDLCSRKEAIE